MEIMAHGIPFVEIPFNYGSRAGESSVTGSLWKAIKLRNGMIDLVWELGLGLRRHVCTSPLSDGHSLDNRAHVSTEISLARLAQSVGAEEGRLNGLRGAG